MLPPAQAPAIRHLERLGDQVLVLLVGRASPDRGFGLADQGRQFFNQNASRYATNLGGCVFGHLLHHREALGDRVAMAAQVRAATQVQRWRARGGGVARRSEADVKPSSRTGQRMLLSLP